MDLSSLRPEPRSPAVSLVNGYEVKRWEWYCTLPKPAPRYKMYVGVDAGRFFGLAHIEHISVRLISGELPQMEDGAMAQAFLAHDLLDGYFRDIRVPVPVRTVLEGAAYGSMFGEANLAYIRAGFALAARRFGQVEVIPPATIRKAVLGHGRKRVGEVFKVGPHARLSHALDALGCALYAAGLTEDDDGD